MNDPASILLIEDDEIDALAVQRALSQAGFENEVIVARDGAEGLGILRGDRLVSPPGIVLLDLNMPRMGGFEFLSQLREDPDLKGLVVVVLTTSDFERDRMLAQMHGVADYVVKRELSLDCDRLVDIVRPFLDAA